MADETHKQRNLTSAAASDFTTSIDDDWLLDDAEELEVAATSLIAPKELAASPPPLPSSVPSAAGAAAAVSQNTVAVQTSGDGSAGTRESPLEAASTLPSSSSPEGLAAERDSNELALDSDGEIAIDIDIDDAWLVDDEHGPVAASLPAQAESVPASMLATDAADRHHAPRPERDFADDEVPVAEHALVAEQVRNEEISALEQPSAALHPLAEPGAGVLPEQRYPNQEQPLSEQGSLTEHLAAAEQAQREPPPRAQANVSVPSPESQFARHTSSSPPGSSVERASGVVPVNSDSDAEAADELDSEWSEAGASAAAQLRQPVIPRAARVPMPADLPGPLIPELDVEGIKRALALRRARQ